MYWVMSCMGRVLKGQRKICVYYRQPVLPQKMNFILIVLFHFCWEDLYVCDTLQFLSLIMTRLMIYYEKLAFQKWNSPILLLTEAHIFLHLIIFWLWSRSLLVEVAYTVYMLLVSSVIAFWYAINFWYTLTLREFA